MVAFMGMGEGTDIRAHCMGTVWGLVMGYIFTPFEKQLKSALWQFLLVSGVYGLFITTWFLALGG